jgi:hypothetical protein
MKTIAGRDTGGTIHLWDARAGALRTDRELPGSGRPANSVTSIAMVSCLPRRVGGIRLWKWGSPERPYCCPTPSPRPA